MKEIDYEKENGCAVSVLIILFLVCVISCRVVKPTPVDRESDSVTQVINKILDSFHKANKPTVKIRLF